MEPGSQLFSAVWAVLFVAGVLLMTLALLGGLGLCTWALAPVSKRGLAQLPAQFRIVDLAGLVFELSVLAAIVGNISTATDISSLYLFVSAAVPVCGCWWAGVRLLTRARVDDPKRRLTMYLLVVPLTILCSAYLVLGATAGFLVFGSLRDFDLRDLDLRDFAPILVVLAGMAAAVLLMVLCRALSSWIVADTPMEPAAAISPPPELPGL